jgi:capsular exopolysaccharide synthesis family protein
MSQIFDALRQSESDRSGAEVSAAAELLEVVEQNANRAIVRGAQRKAKVDHETAVAFATVHVRMSPQNKFVCFTDPDSLAAEKFRFLGIRLRYLQQKKPIKCILVTSSVAGEGKSTVAGNLACVLAASKQQKVLLLEGDLRRPSLGEQIGIGNLPGLCELLEVTPEKLTNIYSLEELGICILPAGGSLRNPLEFLQPGKVSGLMDRLAPRFDWIIIDSPPILPLADTSIWMRLSDAVLLVTRPSMTARQQLQRSLEAIEQSKLIGAIMNGSREATANNYYQYYGSRSGTTPPVSDSPTRLAHS